jgi:hypothetical protein
MRYMRNADGRFRRGVSGNPGGRPRKVMALEAALEGARDPDKVLPVIDKLRELAMGGDVAAARVYLDRVLGPVRPWTDEDGEDLSGRSMEDLVTEAARIPEVRAAIVDAMVCDPAEREALRRVLAAADGTPRERAA